MCVLMENNTILGLLLKICAHILLPYIHFSQDRTTCVRNESQKRMLGTGMELLAFSNLLAVKRMMGRLLD